MQLPHCLTVVTPVEVVDEYDNPSPRLDYGPGASVRTVQANVQPVQSTEPAATARSPVVTRWKVFTFEPVGPGERIEWSGRVLDVEGTPDFWAPRFGRGHYEFTMRHVEG